MGGSSTSVKAVSRNKSAHSVQREERLYRLPAFGFATDSRGRKKHSSEELGPETLFWVYRTTASDHRRQSSSAVFSRTSSRGGGERDNDCFRHDPRAYGTGSRRTSSGRTGFQPATTQANFQHARNRIGAERSKGFYQDFGRRVSRYQESESPFVDT